MITIQQAIKYLQLPDNSSNEIGDIKELLQSYPILWNKYKNKRVCDSYKDLEEDLKQLLKTKAL